MRRRASSPLYRTSRWLKKRDYQLTHEPLCRLCVQLGRETPATVADHIVPHRGDEIAFWTGELQSLCSTCHDGAKQEQERTGHLRGGHVDGTPADPLHPWNTDP